MKIDHASAQEACRSGLKYSHATIEGLNPRGIAVSDLDRETHVDDWREVKICKPIQKEPADMVIGASKEEAI